MFSKIFNSAKAIIRKTRTEQELYNHTQPARQLQSELSNAVGEGMVTTRRQSHGLPNEELRDGSEIDTPRNISRKRKNKESAASTPLALPVKRRKTSLEHLDNDGQMPSGPSVPTPTPSGKEESTVQEDKAGNDAIESHKREKDSLELGARQFTSKSEAGNEDCDKTPGVKHKEQGASSQGNKATANRALQIQGDHLRVEAPDLTVTPDSETTRNAGISTAPKAIHFRFGSEEPSANATNMNNGQVLTDALSVSVVEGSEESDAEDEAPEIVSASVGAKRAKARNQEADKAAERQRAAAKEKRRERNAILSQQARSSKKVKKRTAVETLDDESELDDVVDSAISHLESPPNHTKSIARRPLPALLPDDILAAVPAARPATPPLDQKPSKASKPKKYIFVESDPKAPRDIKRGPVRVRVLEGSRQSLPPKTSKESRNIKESWLGGRRGRNGAAVMERRKVGSGFARK